MSTKPWLVQATLNGREYTHYTCETELDAETKATLLGAQYPELMPIRVVGFTLFTLMRDK